jgi:heptose-I-phosphate ethanolaminephosphotransferase
MFLSYNDFRHVTLHDEVLLEKLSDKLKFRDRKVIFLHLIGTHYDYSKRYPDDFSKFNSENNSKQNVIIDTYDNAVLYNDYIVSEVIKLVSKTSQKSAVIYFSDHGEEVYDTVDYFGHFDDKPTPAMYEIPFLVYLSKDYIKPKDFVIDTSRKYMLDDFPHSLSHLIGIEGDLLETNRSIFSTKFDERKRVIRDSLDFDVFKRKQTK